MSNLPPACSRVNTISITDTFSCGVQAEGNAAAVVFDADRVHRYASVTSMRLPKLGERFVGGVVDHLLHDVQRVVGAGVHARPLLDGFQALLRRGSMTSP